MRMLPILALTAVVTGLSAPTIVVAQVIHPYKCAAENPSTWPLRFTLGQTIEPAQCLAMCNQGGGNGYFCLSRPTGTCLCGTATKPASSAPHQPGACTATCASGSECGGPGNVYSCNPAPASPCPAAPDECAVGAGSLRTQVLAGGNNLLRWKWRRGAVERDDLGDPLADTAYHACIYADGALIDELAIEPGANWYRRDNGDVAYFNRETNDDGVNQLTLHPNASRGRIWLEGRGPNLALTEPPLAYETSVDIQLRTDDGACWGASFAAPARRNRPGRFYDR